MLKFVERPRRINSRVVVGNDFVPGLGRRDMPLPASPDPIADHPGQGIETRRAIDTAFADPTPEQFRHRALAGARIVEIEFRDCLAFERRHRHHRFGQIAQIEFDVGPRENFDGAPDPAFGMHRTRDPDRLMRRAE